VLVAVAFGAWGLGLFPGQDSTNPPSAGLPAVEAWLAAAVIYAALAVIAGRSTRSAVLLGFARQPETVATTEGVSVDERTGT
jgi:hypothetical protein